MKKLVGLYVLGKLWQELQGLTPDSNGIIRFNFERFKRVHDIAPDAIVPE